MEKLFPCMEIGSLKKPKWLTRVEKCQPVETEHVADMRAWAEELDINSSQLELLLKEPAKNLPEIAKWASLFAVRMQEQAGLDVIWNGEMWRSEMYEDPIGNTGGMNFVSDYSGTHVWGDNYYRAAECAGQIQFTKPWHLEEFLHAKRIAKKPIKVPITDAHTLGEWSYDSHYVKNKDAGGTRARRQEAKREFILELARGPLRENIKQLVANGAKIIQLDGPAAVTDLREYTGRLYDVPLFVEAFNEATKGIDAEFHSHICYPPEGGYELLFKYAMEMKKCAQFNLEFANRDLWSLGASADERPGYAALSVFKEHNDGRRVGLGVLDVHNDNTEPLFLIEDRLLYASKVLGDSALVIAVPDCGLRTRSLGVAHQKLCSLVAGADLARAVS